MAERNDSEIVEIYLTGDDGIPLPDSPRYYIRRIPKTGHVTDIVPEDKVPSGPSGAWNADRAIALPQSEVGEDNSLRGILNAASSVLVTPNKKNRELQQEVIPIPQREQAADLIQNSPSNRNGSQELRGRK